MMKPINATELSDNLQFMALFIAVYESFIDYVQKTLKNFFEDGSMCQGNQKDFIEEQEKRHKQEKEAAIEKLKEIEKSKVSIDDIHFKRIKTYAEFDYIKITEDNWVKWLSPNYNEHIKSRVLTINGKKQKKPKVLLNSLMWFVDMNAITQSDFDDVLQIQSTRNRYAHEMADYLINDTTRSESNILFDKLLNLYKKINNYWSVEFEVSIGGEDINNPEKIDFENAIDVKLYNLLLAIDVMQNKHNVINKKWDILQGLYDCVMLPIKEEI